VSERSELSSSLPRACVAAAKLFFIERVFRGDFDVFEDFLEETPRSSPSSLRLRRFLIDRSMVSRVYEAAKSHCETDEGGSLLISRHRFNHEFAGSIHHPLIALMDVLLFNTHRSHEVRSVLLDFADSRSPWSR
jgi:hypothetical protein